MTAQLFDVASRVVIVTGGGRGIGRVYCEALAKAGMRVVLADIQGDAAERAAAAIRAAGGIVNISSGRVLEGTPNRLHYTTAKAGVIGFTRALARELGPDKINVNVVLPGLTLSDTQVASSQAGYLNDAYNERRALKRAQYPEDLVGTMLYLLSDASDFVTGQSFNVDGGKVMH
jgi:NAD(P)-dependent dehydrogenase (short-subunit alcohol dehydrogenase family)